MPKKQCPVSSPPRQERSAGRGVQCPGKKKGLLITLEGPEGAGKSTHAKVLTRWLSRRGFPVVLTREPGGTPLSQRLRRLLLDRRSAGMDPWMELCLYEAARAALVSQVIGPALKKGKICVVDRFQDSTWVYQGWAGGLPLSLVEMMGRAATGGLQPDATILLDLPVEAGLGRATRPNRMEAKPISFHRKVREGFRVLARRHRRRFHLIRADRPPDEVQRKIQKVMEDVLGAYRRA